MTLTRRVRHRRAGALPRVCSLTLFTLSLALALGCSSGGSSGGSGGSGGTQLPSTPPPAPGTSSNLGAAVTSATVTTSLNAVTNFSSNRSLSDLVTSGLPGLETQLFAVEDAGLVRVYLMAGAAPIEQRTFQALTLPNGTFAGGLTIQTSNLALLTSSGPGAERVALFDPIAAQSAADVTVFDLNALTVSWPAGTLDSLGNDVGGQNLALTFTSDAAIAAGKLFVTHSNFGSNFENQPGTLTSYTIDLATNAIAGRQTQQTSDLNPTSITVLDTPQGQLLLVLNTGPFLGTEASLDLVDPVSLNLVGRIQFNGQFAQNPVGLVVSPDGRRAYVGSQTAARVFVIDIENLGQELTNTSPAQLSSRVLGSYVLASNSASNFISDLAISHTGEVLYAVNFNESALYVIDLRDQDVPAKIEDFLRTGTAANFESLANLVALRPGVPGTDFTGPQLVVGTINLAPADRTSANVTVVLDQVETDAF